MNETTEVNSQLLKLIKYLHQKFSNLETKNNRTNPSITTNTHNPPNPSNIQNRRRRITRKGFGPTELARIPVWIAT